MDTLEHHAAVAEGILAGRSPGVAAAAISTATAADMRARRLYRDSLAAFRSNLLDAADRADSPALRGAFLTFLRTVDANAPTSQQMDAALAGQVQQ